jgi:hypothetical protein
MDDALRAGRIAGQVRPDVDDVNRRLGHDRSLSGAQRERGRRGARCIVARPR